MLVHVHVYMHAARAQVSGVGYSAETSTLVSCSVDGSVAAVSLAARGAQPISLQPRGGGPPQHSLQAARDVAVSAGDGGAMFVWSLREQRLLHTHVADPASAVASLHLLPAPAERGGHVTPRVVSEVFCFGFCGKSRVLL